VAVVEPNPNATVAAELAARCLDGDL